MEYTEFNVTAEMVYRTDDDMAEDLGAALLDELSSYGPVLSESVSRRQLVTITLPAPNLKTAIATAITLITDTAGEVVSVQAMHTSDYDDNAGAIQLPGEFLSVTDAAARLGTSRQNILSRIKRGSLPAGRNGNQWIIPAEAVQGPAGE